MINRVVLVGRLSANPTKNVTTNGTAVTSFTVAVDNPTRKDGTNTASFIRCQAWGNTADYIEKYATKGSLVAVDGRLVTNSYNRKDGTKAFSTEVVCETFKFVGSKSSSSNSNDGNSNDFSRNDEVLKSSDEPIDVTEDDLPF